MAHQPLPIHTLPVTIDAAEVCRLLGYPADREPPPRVAALIEPLLAEARRQARGRGVWTKLPVASASELGLEPVDALALAVGLVTVGPAIEERASACVAQGEETAALILDFEGKVQVARAPIDRIRHNCTSHPGIAGLIRPQGLDLGNG